MTVPTTAVYVGGFAATQDGALYVQLDPSSGITGTTITATTQFVGPAGSAATPSFTVGSNAGIYSSAGSLAFVNGSSALAGYFQSSGASSALIVYKLGFDPGSTDTFLVRDAANTLALKNGNNAQTFNQYAGNGGFYSEVAFNESLTIAAAATTDSSTTIPAGAQITAVSVRVTTIIPTAATFTVTAATGGTTFNTAAVAVAAGSTDVGTAAGGATYTSAGTKIRITPNLTPGTATGVVRICGYYRLITPPTS